MSFTEKQLGVNLLGSLRGLELDAAKWRPNENRHNIWELAVHCAYWKYSVCRRLSGLPKGSFPLKGTDWFPRPQQGIGKEWKSDLDLLRESHERLVEAVSGFNEIHFGHVPKGSGTTFRDLTIGAVAHDLYHAGQIQLLKRLHGANAIGEAWRSTRSA